MAKNIDLTKGNISKGLWAFAIPLMLGNVMQQFYNLADTWVVGRFIGNTALAAVGSSYTLMTFLTSIIMGLSLGSSTFISMAFGNKDNRTIRNGIVISSEITCGLTIILIIISYTFLDKIIKALNVPDNTFADMRTYLFYVFIGFFATYIYNYCSNLLRAVNTFNFSWRFSGVKYNTRFIFCNWTWHGNNGSSSCYGNFPVYCRAWNIDILHNKISGIQSQKRRLQVEQKQF